MPLLSPALTPLTLEEAPARLWHEFLKGYYDGQSHPVSVGSGVFPTVLQPDGKVALAFDQGELPQPLHGSGVGILVVTEMVGEKEFMGEDGRYAVDEMRTTFYIRGAQTGPDRAGNGRYLARRAAELLRAVLRDDEAVHPLAQKGITQLRLERSTPAESADGPLRIVRARWRAEYEH